jgi:hypothetical protein
LNCDEVIFFAAIELS